MTVYSAVKAFISGYDGLEAGAPVTTDNMGSEPDWYAIIPTPGSKIIETDIAGNTKRQFTFAFQSTRYTADEYERLESIEFFELFEEWLEEQTNAGTLPTLASGKTSESIEATSAPFLLQVSESSTGIYTIPCRLVYEQDAS